MGQENENFVLLPDSIGLASPAGAKVNSVLGDYEATSSVSIRLSYIPFGGKNNWGGNVFSFYDGYPTNVALFAGAENILA